MTTSPECAWTKDQTGEKQYKLALESPGGSIVRQVRNPMVKPAAGRYQVGINQTAKRVDVY